MKKQKLRTLRKALISGGALCGMLVACLSCKSTHFTQVPVTPGTLTLSCETRPAGAVSPHSPLSIIVEGAKDYTGRIEQSITGPTAPGNVMLVQEGGKVVREDRRENVFHFAQEGTYTISLKGVDYETQLTGSCQFTVFDRCPAGSHRIGVNVAFVVDNSGSHSKSDCPQSQALGQDNAGNKLVSCRAQTHREHAVAYATSILGELGNRGGNAQSYVSFASFPRQGTSASSGKWYSASQDYSAFVQELTVLRNPKGVTPYYEGIQAATELFAQIKDQSQARKKNILIFVTDGFPTDKDPRKTLKLAQTLQNVGVEIVPVMVTGKDSQSNLRRIHQGYMEQNFASSWRASHYSDYTSYFQELLGDGTTTHPGLLHNMSSSGSVIYVENSSHLKTKIDGAVTKEALICQKSSP